MGDRLQETGGCLWLLTWSMLKVQHGLGGNSTCYLVDVAVPSLPQMDWDSGPGQGLFLVLIKLMIAHLPGRDDFLPIHGIPHPAFPGLTPEKEYRPLGGVYPPALVDLFGYFNALLKGLLLLQIKGINVVQLPPEFVLHTHKGTVSQDRKST